jgi:hypothetical protein
MIITSYIVIIDAMHGASRWQWWDRRNKIGEERNHTLDRETSLAASGVLPVNSKSYSV